MLMHWIWLAHHPKLTMGAKLKLLAHFGDPEEIWFTEDTALAAVEDLSAEAKEALRDRSLTEAEKIIEKCSRDRIGILTLEDAAYPARLKHIYDPPLVLYYRGTLPEFDGRPVIGIVGTRKATPYGLQAAYRIGYQIGRCGGIVVSGLAAGVDAMAMTGALAAEQPVVGVLGCGVDVVYPRSNRELFRKTEDYGCILSEYAPGTEPVKWNFPSRNRIISGLSNGVLVVEAPEKSGALITARQAADQGRDVFVVPGNIDMDSCVGSNRLLRSGALPVGCGWDVMSEYESLYPETVHRDDSLPKRDPPLKEEKSSAFDGKNRVDSTGKQDRKNENDKIVIDKEQSSPYSDVNDIPPNLSKEEQCIVAALQNGVRLVDDVIAETGMTTGRFLSLLTMLELKKVIVRHPGKRISLIRMK